MRGFYNPSSRCRIQSAVAVRLVAGSVVASLALLYVDDRPSMLRWLMPKSKHGSRSRDGNAARSRTAVFVAMSGPVTTIKALIFERLLCTSPFDVVVAVDMGQKNATSSSVLSLIRAAAQSTNTHVTLVPVSYAQLVRRHTGKISNFAGGGSGGEGTTESPAKLGALDWLAGARYQYMWHLEDDAWSADFGLFASRYARSTADLIIHNESELPFWAHWTRGYATGSCSCLQWGNCTTVRCQERVGWKIGSLRHVLGEGSFCFASLAAYRASRTFARAVLHTIAREHTQTSHHELYLPYVISLNPRLAWEPLRPDHQTLFSTGSVADFQPLCALRRAEMYHPVKSERGAIEGYNLLNPACTHCPHPARDVADWSACRQLCDRWRPLSGITASRGSPDECTGWVYNSNSQCYLKGGVLQWKREAYEWGGTTWSGPASSSGSPITLPLLSLYKDQASYFTPISTKARKCAVGRPIATCV